MAKTLTAIILDTRRALKDGTYPVKLRITNNRKKKLVSTKYSLTEEEFAATQVPKPRGKYFELKKAFQAIDQEAIDVIDKLPVFTFEGFEKKLKQSAGKKDIFAAYDLAIQRLNEDGQVSTANMYETASLSLLSFMLKIPLTSNKGISLKEAKAKRESLLIRRMPLPFPAITVEFLMSFEKWMLQNSRSPSTISMYLRTLRTLFNDAISFGDVHADLYPFGKRKYQVPAGRNVKKALTKKDLQKIFFYQPKHESEAKSRDYWVFSYLCNGANMKDIARLKYKQLTKDTITFIRAKTQNTTRHNQKTLLVVVTPQIQQIIERWGNKPVTSDSYIFPILKNGVNPEQELALVKQAVKTVNKYIKRIAAEVGIEMNVSTYSARHSFSTVLKRAGVSTAFISESLGHSSEKTTQNYLDSFEDDAKRKYASLLTDFDS